MSRHEQFDRPTSLGRTAHWRQQKQFWDTHVQVRIPCLNKEGTLMYPPNPGELPGYELLLDCTEDKQQFRNWYFKLSAEDQARITDAIRLERIP